MKKDYHAGAMSSTFWSSVLPRSSRDPAVVFADETFRLLEPWLAELKPGAELLDGGCGDGNWALALQARGFNVTAVDIIDDRIRELASRYPQIHWRTADVTSLPFPDGSFGYLSLGVFEHFEDGLGRPLHEAHRALRPRGLLFIAIPYENLRLSLTAHADAKLDGCAFYQWRLTTPELRLELRCAGFDVLATHRINKTGGARRMLHQLFHLPQGPTMERFVTVLSRTLPSFPAAHMQLAVARRR